MQWQFIPQPACFVETGVTQRDQFRNDEVDLFDTIVRESIQNSLDATANGETTRVHFKWVDSEDNLDAAYLKGLFNTQVDHARSSGLEVDLVDFSKPSALIIEDFGTRGLTGSVKGKDNDNFSDFWRRHGRSHKTGRSRGRWGLGKLVYSSSSLLRVFFGLTIRNNDPEKYLMGQTVLDLRTYEGMEYPAHAYFSEMEGEGINNMIPVPTTASDYIETFSKQFGLTRANEPGLSVVIPFPHQALTRDNMIGVSIVNYFYPILAGQLILNFNGQEINAENIRELAHTYAIRKIPDIDQLFDFIEEVNAATQNEKLLSLKPGWVDDVRLDEDDFAPDDLESFRAAFSERKIVGVRLPLTIKTKPEMEFKQTEFFVFIKRPEELTKGVDLYVRGGLTLPAESKFGERKAFGAMIANEESISAFLGDAENPAHTKWIYNAEKLRRNYVAPGDKLRVVKNALLNFYDMLSQSEEEEDAKALVNFFFTDLPEQPGQTPDKPKRTPPTIVDPIPVKPRIARLESIEGGFSILRGDGANEASYPLRFVVQAAYDTASGNPFKKFSPLDFDFTKKSELKIAGIKKKFELKNRAAELKSRAANKLEFEITGPKFLISVTGFDPNRDLLVKLKSESMEGA